MRESALQALGCLGIARPATLLSRDTQAAMQSALRPSAPPQLKIRALHNLAELLKASMLEINNLAAFISRAIFRGSCTS